MNRHIKDIRLDASLPASISPNVLNILVKKFSITPIVMVDNDIDTILNKKKVGT
jgi:hydroxylamine reductase